MGYSVPLGYLNAELIFLWHISITINYENQTKQFGYRNVEPAPFLLHMDTTARNIN